jgi:SAM-dependent methyltransferase
MCNRAVIRFIEDSLDRADVAGKDILEVGSLDVNGSVRPYLESLEPRKYVGVDIAEGPRVDEICDVSDLVSRYGEGAFDIVVSTELVEHVRDWRGAFSNMKHVVRPGGLLLITTRSFGTRVHGYPYDFWRYEPSDMERIFADFAIDRLDADDLAPGVFVKARRPEMWAPADLSEIALYSVVTKSRTVDVTSREVATFKILYQAHQAYRRILPESVRAPIKRILRR